MAVTISSDTLTQLTDNLQHYNPTLNTAVEKAAGALQPLALAFLSILFLMEWLEMSKKFNVDNGGLTLEALAELGIKYLIAVTLILGGTHIVDALVWCGIALAKIINTWLPAQSFDGVVKPPSGHLGFMESALLTLFQFLAQIFVWISEMIIKILVFLRSIQLYMVKVVIPIFVVFFMSEQLKGIAIGFLKQIAAIVIQGAVLVLVVGIAPLVFSNDFANIAASGDVMTNLANYIGIIIKMFVFAFLLVGSQNKAKQWIGA